MTTVGIDFGNIVSSVAIIQNERSEVVADAGGHRYFYSLKLRTLKRNLNDGAQCYKLSL
jgi:molecular chaperone DnaK (HSP70)